MEERIPGAVFLIVLAAARAEESALEATSDPVDGGPGLEAARRGCLEVTSLSAAPWDPWERTGPASDGLDPCKATDWSQISEGVRDSLLPERPTKNAEDQGMIPEDYLIDIYRGLREGNRSSEEEANAAMLEVLRGFKGEAEVESGDSWRLAALIGEEEAAVLRSFRRLRRDYRKLRSRMRKRKANKARTSRAAECLVAVGGELSEAASWVAARTALLRRMQSRLDFLARVIRARREALRRLADDLGRLDSAAYGHRRPRRHAAPLQPVPSARLGPTLRDQ